MIWHDAQNAWSASGKNIPNIDTNIGIGIITGGLWPPVLSNSNKLTFFPLLILVVVVILDVIILVVVTGGKNVNSVESDKNHLDYERYIK